MSKDQISSTFLKDMAYFYANTDRSKLEQGGLIQIGAGGDTAWKRFNHNFDIFILKLDDDKRHALTDMINSYCGGSNA
jgi:hypothetical protein